METKTIKSLFDACYLAKRILDLLPALPGEVTASYIRYLDVIKTLEGQGIQVKVSDISDVLNIPRPGVTRTVKEMESKGYLRKQASPQDGRVTHITATPAGEQLHHRYNEQYFDHLAAYLDDMPESDAQCATRTIERFYRVMLERRDLF